MLCAAKLAIVSRPRQSGFCPFFRIGRLVHTEPCLSPCVSTYLLKGTVFRRLVQIAGRLWRATSLKLMHRRWSHRTAKLVIRCYRRAAHPSGFPLSPHMAQGHAAASVLTCDARVRLTIPACVHTQRVPGIRSRITRWHSLSRYGKIGGLCRGLRASASPDEHM